MSVCGARPAEDRYSFGIDGRILFGCVAEPVAVGVAVGVTDGVVVADTEVAGNGSIKGGCDASCPSAH